MKTACRSCVAGAVLACIMIPGDSGFGQEARAAARAERLSKVRSITELSAAEAKKLVGEFRGEELPLDSVRGVSANVADELATHTSLLSLDAVATLDDPSADALAKTRGRISLRGLTELKSPRLAKTLADQGGELDLSRIKRVPAGIALILAAAKGPLVMRGLTTLDSPELARKLAESEDVVLQEVTSIDQPVAAALVSRPNYLSLNGITRLTLPLAQELGKHRGMLDLDRAAFADPGAIEELAKCKGPLDLGVRQLNAVEARALAAHEGVVTLACLETPAAAVLAELREHGDILYLTGMTRLGVAEATALVGCKGVVYLTGVETMDAQTAEALATHRGAGTSCLVLSASLSVSPVAPVLQRNRRIAFGSHVFR